MKCGFICRDCWKVEFDEKVLRKSLCSAFRGHCNITQACYMCQNCYALGNDLSEMRMQSCPMTRAKDNVTLVNEESSAPCRNVGSAPPLPLPASASPAALAKTMPHDLGSRPMAPPEASDPLKQKQADIPQHNPELKTAMAAATAELDKLLLLKALQEERTKLENLILRKREDQALKAAGSRSLASIEVGCMRTCSRRYRLRT